LLDYNKFMSMQGYTSCDKLKAINNIISNRKNVNTVVEVGSYCGRSSSCIAETIGENIDLYCIDHFLEERWASGKYADGKDGRPLAGTCLNQRAEFEKITKSYKNIKMVTGYFPYDIKWSGGDIDIFFLDSDHQNPDDTDILTHICKFMPAGSLIIGDDAKIDYAHGHNVFYNISILEKAYDTKAKFDFKNGNYTDDLWTIEVTKDYINLKDYI